MRIRRKRGVRDIYVVLRTLAWGGRTTVVCSRSNLMAAAGYRVTILVLEHNVSLQRRIDDLRSHGLLNRKVRVIGLFDSLARQADRAARKRRPQIRKLDTPLPGGVTSELDDEGRVRKTSRHVDSQLVGVRYFSSQGHMYAQSIPQVAGWHKMLVYDSEAGAYGQYSGYFRWQAAWVSSVVRASHAKPVVICDSPDRGKQVLARIDDRLAYKVGALHGNHFALDANSPDPQVHPMYDRFLSAIDQMHAFVTLTEAQASDIRDMYGQDEKVVVIPNPVKMPPPTGKNTEQGRIAIFARLHPSKRIEDGIRSFAHIKREVPHACLDIFGEGPLHEALDSLIRELGLQDSVRLRGHTMEPHDEMAASAVTLLPTNTEGLPTVITESFLAGTPVISYDVKYGPADLIDDGVDGVLVPHGDIDTLASETIRLLRDPELAARMGERGRAKIRDQYDGEIILGKWTVLFDRLHTGR